MVELEGVIWIEAMTPLVTVSDASSLMEPLVPVTVKVPGVAEPQLTPAQVAAPEASKVVVEVTLGTGRPAVSN